MLLLLLLLCVQLTAEVLKRYIDLEAKFIIGWLMQFPGVYGGGGGTAQEGWGRWWQGWRCNWQLLAVVSKRKLLRPWGCLSFTASLLSASYMVACATQACMAPQSAVDARQHAVAYQQQQPQADGGAGRVSGQLAQQRQHQHQHQHSLRERERETQGKG